jgi:AMMECR1 domain-containing protein
MATIEEELIANALNAAMRDPRFPPVTLEELPSLRYSVDVLSTPESTTDAGLDPKTYGIIVEDPSGERRGLLLPDIEGVDSVDQQIAIAKRKAGISPGAPVRLSRFRVERFREKPGRM